MTDMDAYLISKLSLGWALFALGVSITYFVQGWAERKGARK